VRRRHDPLRARCLTCAPTYTPEPELCDDFDNDCSGVVDDGDPLEVGDPPPQFAARLLDVSVPSHLDLGERGAAWAGFKNEGLASWHAGELMLWASLAMEHHGSELYDADSWPAWDVASVLDRDVAPGDTGYFSWRVQAPLERGEAAEQFRLSAPDGSPVRCPVAAVDVVVHVGGDETAAAPETAPALDDGCSCRTAGARERGRDSATGWLGLGLAALAVRRRRRPRR